MISPIVAGFLAANAVLDTAGQLAFKTAATHTEAATHVDHWRQMLRQPWIWLGVSCFCLEFVAWLVFLSLVPLAQGVLLGMINIVVVMLGGRWFFRERLTRLRLLGIVLIVGGVSIVGLG